MENVAFNNMSPIERFREIMTSHLGAPLLLLAILAMVVVPLPTIMLDLLFSFNIALSIVVLLAVVYVARPLDFSVFPTILLLTTLLRLSLNIASTRIVLLEGHNGGDAAGKVIESFGEFVIGGNYFVGFVVFLILTVINFVVVTKGAGRISEVSARFILDAMPGRQMAIDADLNGGVITREEAKAKREEVRQEADFYGSMDGASKFVRGDAIAGLLILFVNVIGGLAVGTVQHDLSIGDASRTYILLTIGDGLVAQLPALLLSTGVAVLVTRMSQSQDMGKMVVAQMFGQPKALAVTAALLGAVGLVPGMPNLAFLLLAAACGYAAWKINKQRSSDAVEKEKPTESKPAELSWDDVTPADALSLEVGYRLVPLVDTTQGGELLTKVKGVRKKLTTELGFLVPAVHIRDNLELPPNGYRIMLHGSPIAAGDIQPDRELAINPGKVYGQVEGTATKDPTFGLDALWIEPAIHNQAQAQGYTVVDPSSVIATHLAHVVKGHGQELLGHDEVQQMLNGLGRTAPKLVEDLTPKLLPLSAIVRVLQNLLMENVPIRNLKLIAETLAEHGVHSQEAHNLTAAVRTALGREIVQEIVGLNPELPVITLAQPLEQMLQDSVANGSSIVEPELAESMHQAITQSVHRREAAGEPAVILVPGVIRPLISRLTRTSIPGLHVLAYHEVPEGKNLRLVESIGGQNSLPPAP